MGDDGWTFAQDLDGTAGDRLHGDDLLREIYLRAEPDASGRVTVPLLRDKRRGAIVSNESAEIIRMLNSAYDGITGGDLDLYPEGMRGEIDAANERIYEAVNNGVCKAGSATSQDTFEAACHPLSWLEERLGRTRRVAGDRPTGADCRLFTGVVRFDHVYHTHFECNRARIMDHPNLSGRTRELYQTPGVAETVNLDHIRQHCHTSHDWMNPASLVPPDPEPDWDAPHGRGG